MSTIERGVGFPLNSTNGRSYMKVPKPVTLGFQALAALWPGQAERLAAWLFCHPHGAPLRPADAAVLAAGERRRLQIEGHPIVTWSWGEGPTVVLHHGWSGRAAQMVALVDPLLRAGYRVVAFDAPAHGSSPGSSTGLPVLARVLRGLAKHLGGVHAVVAHSIGCAATMLAMGQGLSVDRAVFLAPPSNMRVFLAVFAEQFAMRERIRNGMACRIASWFAIDWAEMDAAHWVRQARPPLLIFHDRQDATVPWTQGRQVREVWRNAELITTQGLGHQAIRRDPQVIARAVAYLAETTPRGAVKHAKTSRNQTIGRVV